MTDRARLSAAPFLARSIEEAALPGTGLAASAFRMGVASVLARLAPRTRPY